MKLPSDLQAFTAPLLKKFVPNCRFVPVQRVILDRNHHLDAVLPIPQGHALTVLSWNIAKNNRSSDWIADFREIQAAYAPDIVFLQEVCIGEDAPHTPGVDDFNWIYAPNYFDAHHQTYSGILTAATAYAAKRRSLTTRAAEPITNTPKISLITEYKLPSRQETLLAVNTHLINFVELSKFQAELLDLERAIAAHRGAMILAGDFNTWNQSRWNLLCQMTARLHLAPVSFPLQENKKIKRFLLSPPLDFVFYRGLQENAINVRVLDQITSSDHQPLITEFFF
jgi:endonuclease/exonuclease/phosphatase (EEP) superfamily protein YafD